jgi:hypothetical protein
MTMSGEGAVSTTAWVTVDTGGMSAANDPHGFQWYRVRATGRAYIAGPVRAPMNKLDSNLRNTISMNFARKENSNAGASVGATVNGRAVVAGPTRTIEVVMQPIATGGYARGITLRGALNMSGGGVIDSFDSGSSFKSTNGLYDVTKRQSHGDVATLNSGSSNLNSTYIYGSLAYSGSTAVKNTQNVQGTISTPFSATISDVSSPGSTTGYTTYAGGSPPFTTVAAGTKAHPTYVYVNGNFSVPVGKSVTISAPNSGTDNNYITIWITGDYNTSGTGFIAQAAGVKSTWYVGGDITTSGSSFQNADGLASAVTMYGYGPTGSKVTVSGGGSFIGVLNAPNYAATISGSGAWSGAIVASSLTISGGASFHYDEALNSGFGSTTLGNYAFASWFEDNSDKARILSY